MKNKILLLSILVMVGSFCKAQDTIAIPQEDFYDMKYIIDSVNFSNDSSFLVFRVDGKWYKVDESERLISAIKKYNELSSTVELNKKDSANIQELKDAILFEGGIKSTIDGLIEVWYKRARIVGHKTEKESYMITLDKLTACVIKMYNDNQ